MRQYEMLELTFSGEAPVGSQSVVDVQATFTKGNFSKTIAGFYDGNGTYKVRFLPEEAGTYTYKVAGLVEGEGALEIQPADGKHHGIVRADGTHLRHEDGTYITTFGTTVYALCHQDEALTEETFETLSQGYFNKVRLCIFPKHYEYNKNEPAHLAFFRDETKEKTRFIDNLGQERFVSPFDPNRPDFDFWADFEAKLERLFAMDIQVDLILFHPYDRWGHSHMKDEENLIYLDYAIRRLAAYPNIWWSMANEYDLFGLDWNLDMWHHVDEFIGSHDPYHHLLSNHNAFPLYDFSRPAITHCSIQIRDMTLVEDLQKKYGKPVLYDECAYEGNLKETWGSITAEEMVNRFWKATVTGGCCTHGEVILDDDIVTKEQQDKAVLWWAKGGKLKGQSPERIRFLKEFIGTLPGPLDPYSYGTQKLYELPAENMEAILAALPEGRRAFVKAVLMMPEEELAYHKLPAFNYAGHVGEECFLFYFDTNIHARFRPELPVGRTYKIEAIDAWNMTREPVAEHVKTGDEIRMPSKPYMAVLATRE